jgi:predicted Zn-dependent protease
MRRISRAALPRNNPSRQHDLALRRIALAFVFAMVIALAQICWADARTPVKPGWNLFTPDQDIQIGQQASARIGRQVLLLNDTRVDDYLDGLGKRLASYAPGYKFPYQYRCVNDENINAFALPGGFIYINRGVIEAADDEAQLAGVMAHETSHVALRHGTNQVSKAEAWRIPLGLLGAAGGLGGLIGQVGAGFTLNSIILKYSRDDEMQADVLGTQILYDAGYDPRALAQFFEKIEAESKGKEPAQFFSDHPNPGNRIGRIDEEVDKLGGPEPDYRSDSDDFRSIKIYIMKLPKPPKRAGK